MSPYGGVPDPAVMLAHLCGRTKLDIGTMVIPCSYFETPQQFAQLGEDILKLSERMPVAASGIGDIVAAAGQAGIAREELLRFAEDAAKVAVAFDISGGEAGGRITGLRSIFQLNQNEVMRLAGAYNHLSNNMYATAPAMLNVAERTGSVAKQPSSST